MKFVLRILYAIYITFTFLQCTSGKSKKEQLIDFLPSNTSEILKFKNLDVARASVYDPENGITIINEELHKRFFTNKILTKTLISTTESNLYFNTNKNSIPAYTFVTKYHDSLFNTASISGITVDTVKNKKHTIYKNQLDTTIVYTTIKDSFFIASSSQKNITTLLTSTTHIDPVLRKIEKLHSDADVVLLKQNLRLSNKEHSLSGWTSLKSNRTENGYTGTGVTAINDSMPHLLKVFKGQVPQPFTAGTIAPREVKSVIAFTLNDAEQLLKNIHTLQDSLTTSKELELFDTATEMGALELNEGNAYYIKSLNAASTTEAIAIHTKKTDIYRGVQLYDIDTTSLISNEITPLLPSIETNIYFTIDDYCLFTKNTATAQRIIAAYINNDVLSKTIDFQEIKTTMTSAASYNIIQRGSNATTTIANFLNSIKTTKSTQNNKAIASIQFSIDGNYAHTQVNYKVVMVKKKVSAAVTEQFRTTLKAPIINAPQFFVHQSATNTIVQDNNHVLYMVSSNGKTMWKKELDSPILGKVAHIDIKRNNRKQLVFATENAIYVINNKGKDVGPFPKKFKDKITQPLAVFDYDNKRNYRFLVTQGNRLYMYDSQAKLVKGFKFKKTNTPIKHLPKHLRIGNKDYIAITEDSGKLHLVSRTGKERVHVKQNFNFSETPVQKEGTNFVIITNDGEKKTITPKGKVSAVKLDVSDAYFHQMYGNTKVTLDDFLLRINGILIELPLGVYTQPKLIMHKGTPYILITETQENKIYLYTKNRKLANGFPIYGVGSASIVSFKNDILITTKGDHNELLLYSVRQ